MTEGSRCAEKVAAAYRMGSRDALDDAVQRVEALPWTSETWLAHAERAAIIAAIKGDQP
jgi:hypothetical protein